MVRPVLENAFAPLVLAAKNALSLQMMFYLPLNNIFVVVIVCILFKHVLCGSLISKEEKWSLHTLQG